MNKKRFTVIVIIIFAIVFLIFYWGNKFEVKDAFITFNNTKQELLLQLEADNKRLNKQVFEIQTTNKDLQIFLIKKQKEVDSLILFIKQLQPTHENIAMKSIALAQNSMKAYEILSDIEFTFNYEIKMDSLNRDWQQRHDSLKIAMAEEKSNFTSRLKSLLEENKELKRNNKEFKKYSDSLEAKISERDTLIAQLEQNTNKLINQNKQLEKQLKKLLSTNNNQLKAIVVFKDKLKLFAKPPKSPYKGKDVDGFEISFNLSLSLKVESMQDTVVLAYTPPPPAVVQKGANTKYFILNDGTKISYTQLFVFNLIQGESFTKIFYISNPDGYKGGYHKFELYSKEGLIGSDFLEIKSK